MSRFRDVWPGLIRLGWPVSATLLVRVTMRTVDLLVVGMAVGATGVAAVGIGDAAARIVLMTALGLGAGTLATVSQHLGAEQPAAADVAVTQTAVLAVAVGVPAAVVGWFGAPTFYALLGADPEVTGLGVTYLRVVIATAAPRMLAIMLTRALQGAADTRSPMVIRTVGTALNIALTVLLVPGLAGLPELGVLGAAIGTAAGNTASALLLLGVLAAGRRPGRLRRAGLWAPATAARIVQVGLPQVAERNLYALAAVPLNGIVLTFGTAANAGFQIGRRAMLYALLPSRGVATAVSTTMGTDVGAGDVDAGEHAARGGMLLAGLVSVAAAVPMVVLARPIAGAFLSGGAALDAATAWVRVYSLATITRAVYGVLRGALQGAGDTTSPLWATTVGVAGFALGFSWLVGIQLGVGLAGVYAGVLLDPAARTAALYTWFDSGRWRTTGRRVPEAAGSSVSHGQRSPRP